MRVAKLIRDLALTCFVTAGLPAIAAPDGHPVSGERPGRAAAHAALDARADLPAAPPALPAQASDRARGALSETAFGKKGADAQAAQHAHDAVMDAHTEAASNAGQGSVAEAARAANAEVRAAATRARSTSTKSDAASHHGNSGSGPGKP